MITQEPKDKDAQQRSEGEKDDWSYLSLGVTLVLLKLERCVQDVDAARNDGQNDHESSWLDEADEVLVVSFANTGSEPGTVMVEPLDAAVADAAVDCSWRPVDIAGWTVLYFGQTASTET